MLRNALVLLCIASLLGCAVGGKHLYVDGKCISCWNNPVTKETLDYNTLGANNYAPLLWENMMLEGLSRRGVADLSPYGEDYLRHKIGNKIVSVKNNEITYKKKVYKSISELKTELQKHSLKEAYQITVSSQLGKYNFEKEEFPVVLANSFVLSGGNNMSVLPKKIMVNVKNLSDLPNLKMQPDKAEAFLNSRNQSKTLYIRYIVEITDMITESQFQAKIREVQFIDIKPSIVTRDKKEQYAPFSSVKINFASDD